MLSPEESIIGAIIRDRENIQICIDKGLEPKHLKDFHVLYSKILIMYRKQQEITSTTLCLEAPHFADRIINVEIDAPLTLNPTPYIEKLVREETKRVVGKGLIELSDSLKAWENEETYQEVLAKKKAVNDLFIKTEVSSDHSAAAAQMSEEYLTILEKEISGEIVRTPLRTGNKALDQLLGGYIEQNYIVLAARTSTGKTTTGCSLALNLSRFGVKTAIFSKEVTGLKLTGKMACMLSGIEYRKVSNRKLTDGELVQFVDAHSELAKRPLFINGKIKFQIDRIDNEIRRLHRKEGIECFIVDYLQQIEGPKANSKNEELSKVSGRIQEISRDLDVPIIVLAQLNRESEKLPTNAKIVPYIRDCGAIEQDADVIIHLFRMKLDQPRFGGVDPIEPRVMRVEKNRNGDEGTVNMEFDPITGMIIVPDDYS